MNDTILIRLGLVLFVIAVIGIPALLGWIKFKAD